MLQPTQDSKTFLEVLFPSLDNEFIEARLFPIKSESNLKPIQKFYSSKEEVLNALPELLNMQSQGYGIYVGVCPRKEQKGTKEAVGRVHVLWADLDAKGFGDDKQKAFEAIHQFMRKPTMIVDSGHGYHAYWLLKEALTEMWLVEGCLKGIANAVNADSAVCEVSRVMRLPGSVNNKDEANQILVKIVELSQDAVYGLEDFDSFKVTKVEGQEVTQEVKAENWIAQALTGLKEGNRNTVFSQIIGRLIYDKYTPEEAYAMLQPHAEKCQYPLGELKQQIEHLFKDYENDSGDKPKSLIGDILASNVFLFHDQYQEPFILVKSPHPQIMSLKSKLFLNWVKGFSWKKYQVALSDDTIKKEIGVLEAKALFDGPELTVHVRVAKHNNEYFYDLGKGKFVHINSQEWKIVDEAPVYFKQLNHQRPQVEPASGGNLQELLKFINLPTDASKCKDNELLLLVWIVAAFIPGFPHPALTFFGPHGSAKSTLCTLLKGLVDPSELELTSPPKSIDDFMITCVNHWLVPMDNLSSISTELSDALCRAVTGGGSSKRQLYTDADEIIFRFKRVIVINGINLVVDKPDLLSRSLMIELEKIPNHLRRSEKELWGEFELSKAKILGAIFDAVVKAIDEYKNVKLQNKPRMADFMEWGVAIAKVLGYQQHDFEEAYYKNIDSQHRLALEGSTVAQVVIKFMENRPAGANVFTPTELYKELCSLAEVMKVEKSHDWPKGANWLWRKIVEVRTNLEAVGITVTKEDNTGNKVSASTPRRIVLTKVVKNADSADDAVQS